MIMAYGKTISRDQIDKIGHTACTEGFKHCIRQINGFFPLRHRDQTGFGPYTASCPIRAGGSFIEGKPIGT
jgi:hypothetical protein